MVKGTITYACDGCCASEVATFAPRNMFKFGKPFTVGGISLQRQTALAQLVNLRGFVPDGWVWPDPYTGCCYCPTCWEGIVGPEKDEGEKELEDER